MLTARSTIRPPRVPGSHRVAGLDIHGANVRLFDDLDRMAFGHTGDVSSWSKQTKHIAFRALEHAAEVGLTAARDVVDTADGERARLAAIEADNRRYASVAQGLAQGYGDIDYWSKRAKSLALETAATVATTAALCDGPMAAALSDTLKRALTQAEHLGFDGYGDTTYWSQRTKTMARELAPLDTQTLSAQSQAAAPRGQQLSETLRDLARPLAESVVGLAINHYGDVDAWSKQGKLVAFRSGAYAANTEMAVASQRTYNDAERAAALADIEALGTKFEQHAEQVAWHGLGGTDYWSKRAKQFALRAAREVAEVAAKYDAGMAATAGPFLKQALQEAQRAAFDGYGDTGYWSGRTKDMAADATFAMAEARAALKAAVAVTGVPDTDAARLEAEVASNRIIAEELQAVAAGHSAALAPVQKRVSDLAGQINPLVAEDRKVVGRIKTFGLGGLGGLLLASVTSGLGSVHPALSAVPIVCGLAGALGFVYSIHQRQKHADITAKYEPLNEEYQSSEGMAKHLSRQASRAASRAAQAEAARDKAQGKLDVLRMADAVNGKPRSDGGVNLEDSSVIIGGLRVPRK